MDTLDENKSVDDIIGLINSGKVDESLHTALMEYHDYDLAKAFLTLAEDERKQIMLLFTNNELAKIIAYFDIPIAIDTFVSFGRDKAAEIINEMEPDDANDILNEMTEKQVAIVMPLLDKEVQEDISSLSLYDNLSVGSIMNSNYLHIGIGSDVKDAMRLVVKEAPDVETVSTIFVTDSNGMFEGAIDLKKLIVTKSPCLVETIMNANVHTVEATADYHSALKDVQDYDIYALPVVDKGVLKGIITMDDAFEVLTDEAESDYAHLAGLTEDQDVDETIKQSIKKRIPWLAILLVLDIGVSIIDSFFEGVIENWPVLILFQSSILGLAGNCGTQSLAVAVRKLSDNDLNDKDAIKHHLFKESSLGFCLGLILGIASFCFVSILLTVIPSLNIVGAHETLATPVAVGFAVGFAIFVAISISNFVGSFTPIIFDKCHIDPAVASGPFITTINDIVALVVYFLVAYLVLAIII